jgi:hypothetical protein
MSLQTYTINDSGATASFTYKGKVTYDLLVQQVRRTWGYEDRVLRFEFVGLHGYSAEASQSDLNRDDMVAIAARMGGTVFYVFGCPRENYAVDVKISAGPVFAVFTFPSDSPPTLQGMRSAFHARYPNNDLSRTPAVVYLVENGQYTVFENDTEWFKFGWPVAVEQSVEGRKEGKIRMASFALKHPSSCVFFLLFPLLSPSADPPSSQAARLRLCDGSR